MRRIAAPMVGGMVSSTVLTLAVIPAIYALVMQRRLAVPRGGTPGVVQSGQAQASAGERRPV
jgi:Cu(I)/Ag(I) efflux system membrane protein CusA/SilA